MAEALQLKLMKSETRELPTKVIKEIANNMQWISQIVNDSKKRIQYNAGISS